MLANVSTFATCSCARLTEEKKKSLGRDSYKPHDHQFLTALVDLMRLEKASFFSFLSQHPSVCQTFIKRGPLHESS